MSYKCRECGHIFEEPHRWVERHGFTDGMYEHWSACPRCDSCDYDDRHIVEQEEEEENDDCE